MADAAPQLGGSSIQSYWGNTGSAGGVRGGTFDNNGPRGVAVDSATGNVFVADTGSHRIQQFDEEGKFIRTWGWDVVVGGSTGFEVCTVAANCKGGNPSASQAGGAMNTPAGIAINQANGHIYVIDAGDGATTGNRVQEFRLDDQGTPGVPADDVPVFVRAFGQDVIVNAGSPANSNGTGFEVCDTTTIPPNTATECKAGTGTGSLGGTLNMPIPNPTNSHADLAIAPQGAPNAGHVLVTDPLAARVQEFTAVGAFVRAFGWNVDASNSSTSFEVCIAVADCQAGATGSGVGQFAANAVRSIAEDKFGNIYAVEAPFGAAAGTSNFRVQNFTLPGDIVTPQGDFACAVLCGTRSSNSSSLKDNPQNVAVDENGYVYVTKAFPAGTGDPITVLAPGNTYQHRVLKVKPLAGPLAGEVVRVFLANAGRFNKDEPGSITPVHNDFGLTGLAVQQSGLPLYVVNTTSTDIASAVSRVYRLDDIGGLSTDISVSGVGASAATLEATITPADIRLDTFYRFEYSRAGAEDWSEFRAPVAIDPEEPGPNIGNGADGGESSNCSPNVGKRAAICHVSQQIDGLERNQVYEYRLVATTEANGLIHTSTPEQFETSPSKPSALTGVAVWSGPPSTGPSLTFNGQVNPQGAQTSLSFEYGSAGPCSANPCTRAPVFGRDVGHGIVDLDVNSTVAGLASGGTYHYRILATNAEGTSFGADRVVEPASESDRFIELVSNGESHGTGVFQDFRLAVSDDGNRAIFSALAFGEQQSSPSLTSPNISARGASGWNVASMAPPPVVPTVYRGRDETAIDADLKKVLWMERPAPGSYRWTAKSLDGGYAPVSPLLTSLQRVGPEQDRFVLRGASLDQSTIVFVSNSETGGKTLLPDEPLVTGGGTPRYANLYAIRGAGGGGPTLGVVNRDVGGSVVGGACGARLGAAESFANGFESETTRAVSADGSAISFSARPGNPAGCTAFAEGENGIRIYKRLIGTTTVSISEPECGLVPRACTGIGTGNLTSGSKIVTNLVTSRGAFVAGTTIANASILGTNVPAGTKIAQVLSPTELELSVAATASGSGVGLRSNDGDDFFSGASADGGRIFFTSPRQLTDTDTDTGSACSSTPNIPSVSGGCDLYLYDPARPAGQRLTQVSAGEVVAGDHPTIGSGANVLGVVDVSMDGSRAYFIAQGRLAAGASKDAPNLYVFEREAGGTDRIDFVAKLSARASSGQFDRPDRLLWSRGGGPKPAYALPFYDGLGSGRSDGDGHLFVFTSDETLLLEDADAARDLYRYDDSTGQLTCLTCAHDLDFPVSLYAGSSSNSIAGAVQSQRIASEDGSAIVFTSQEQLLPDDANDAIDVYLWRQGPSDNLSLVSGATGETGVAGSGGRFEVDLGGVISPDGQSVFFLTRATILPQDVNNGAFDWYVARVGGGFPQEEGSSDPCQVIGAECQGPEPAIPPEPVPPGSQQSGPGNVKPTKHGRPCPKGKHRVKARGGKTRCVSNKAKKGKKHKRQSRAGADRRVSR
ncbi:MAG TPA: NHL repeat-containing protein [Solirubrobacterales bacterium]|nr:NHL repeat-containing protein [Solirubrobacterales bacterium]